MLPLCGRPSCFTGHYGRRAHPTQPNHLTAGAAQSAGICLCSFLGLGAIFRSVSGAQTGQTARRNRQTVLILTRVVASLQDGAQELAFISATSTAHVMNPNTEKF